MAPMHPSAPESLQNLLQHAGTILHASRISSFALAAAADQPVILAHEWRSPDLLLPTSAPSSPPPPSLLSTLHSAPLDLHAPLIAPFSADQELLSAELTRQEGDGAALFHGCPLTRTALIAPVRDPASPARIASYLRVDSFQDRKWSDKDHKMLRLVAEVCRSLISRPEVFITVPPAVAELPEEELWSRLTGDQASLVETITCEFEASLRRPSVIQDLWSTVGRRLFKERIARFVLAEQVILLALPAFPMKNPDHTTKVLGPMPDLGEALALANLSSFSRRISELYAPGCRILVISDGRVFNDIYTVSDPLVSQYNHYIHTLAGSKNMQLIGLEDFFPGRTNEERRDAIVTLYGRGVESVEEKLEDDLHFLEVYTTFKILLQKDVAVEKKHLGARAKSMLLRNESYSFLIKLLFPHHIRLSIHDHSGKEKIGIHLIGKNIMTPWHGVAVLRKDGSWSIVRKQQAEESGYLQVDALSPKYRKDIVEGQLAGLNVALCDFVSLPFFKEV